MEVAVEIAKQKWSGLCQVRQSPMLHRNKVLAHALTKAPKRKDTLGYLLVIGDQCDRAAPVFVGFAPEGGVGDLFDLVQFANAGHMVMLHFSAATALEVEEQLSCLAPLKCRTDTANWFVRHEAFEDHLRELKAFRASAFEAWNDEDDCEMPVSPKKANHAIKPIIRKAKARPNTKRNAKRRRR